MLVPYSASFNQIECNDAALTLAEKLEHYLYRTLEEDILLELLVTLNEKFEQEYYLIPEGTPHSMLVHFNGS